MASLRTWQPFGKLGAMSARMLSSPRTCFAQLQFCATAFCCYCFAACAFGGWSKEAMFVGCSACNYLQNLLQSTPRSDLELSSLIRLRLGLGFAFPHWRGFACLTFPMATACMRQTGEHYAFQGAQRLAISKSEEECKRSDGSKW